MIKIRKTKSIYHTMNMFEYDVRRSMLIGQGWVPTVDLDAVQEALIAGQKESESAAPPILNRMDAGRLIPPTYFRTNKFTKIFQSIVNAYGMPTYKEANPGKILIFHHISSLKLKLFRRQLFTILVMMLNSQDFCYLFKTSRYTKY